MNSHYSPKRPIFTIAPLAHFQGGRPDPSRSVIVLKYFKKLEPIAHCNLVKSLLRFSVKDQTNIVLPRPYDSHRNLTFYQTVSTHCKAISSCQENLLMKTAFAPLLWWKVYRPFLFKPPKYIFAIQLAANRHLNGEAIDA